MSAEPRNLPTVRRGGGAGQTVPEATARILFLTYGREAVEMAALRCAELKKAGDNAGLASCRKVLRTVRALATSNTEECGTIN